jgi:hypothetical protein
MELRQWEPTEGDQLTGTYRVEHQAGVEPELTKDDINSLMGTTVYLETDDGSRWTFPADIEEQRRSVYPEEGDRLSIHCQGVDPQDRPICNVARHEWQEGGEGAP